MYAEIFPVGLSDSNSAGKIALIDWNLYTYTFRGTKTPIFYSTVWTSSLHEIQTKVHQQVKANWIILLTPPPAHHSPDQTSSPCSSPVQQRNFSAAARGPGHAVPPDMDNDTTQWTNTHMFRELASDGEWRIHVWSARDWMSETRDSVPITVDSEVPSTRIFSQATPCACSWVGPTVATLTAAKRKATSAASSFFLYPSFWYWLLLHNHSFPHLLLLYNVLFIFPYCSQGNKSILLNELRRRASERNFSRRAPTPQGTTRFEEKRNTVIVAYHGTRKKLETSQQAQATE